LRSGILSGVVDRRRRRGGWDEEEARWVGSRRRICLERRRRFEAVHRLLEVYGPQAAVYH
jgi:hypothetical protein